MIIYAEQVLSVLTRADENAYVLPMTKIERLVCYRAQALGLVNHDPTLPNGSFKITPLGRTHLWTGGKR